jgi:hypothetical protein
VKSPPKLTAQECADANAALGRRRDEIDRVHRSALRRWQLEYDQLELTPAAGMTEAMMIEWRFAKKRELIPIEEANIDRLRAYGKTVQKTGAQCGVPELQKREDDALQKALR